MGWIGLEVEVEVQHHCVVRTQSAACIRRNALITDLGIDRSGNGG